MLQEINDIQVDDDVEYLFKLGENRYFRDQTEEKQVADIFATRSLSHLRKMFKLYEASYKECIEAAIKQRGLHKDLEMLVLAISKY